MNLHVNWGHASAQRLKPVVAVLVGGNMHLLTCVNEDLGQCEVRRASEKATRVPIARLPRPPCFTKNRR